METYFLLPVQPQSSGTRPPGRAHVSRDTWWLQRGVQRLFAVPTRRVFLEEQFLEQVVDIWTAENLVSILVLRTMSQLEIRLYLVPWVGQGNTCRGRYGPRRPLRLDMHKSQNSATVKIK